MHANLHLLKRGPSLSKSTVIKYQPHHTVVVACHNYFSPSKNRAPSRSHLIRTGLGGKSAQRLLMVPVWATRIDCRALHCSASWKFFGNQMLILCSFNCNTGPRASTRGCQCHGGISCGAPVTRPGAALRLSALENLPLWQAYTACLNLVNQWVPQVAMRTLKDSELIVSFFPKFAYDARGGGGLSDGSRDG